MTTASAETVLWWFSPIVCALGGSIELATWPPEIYITLPSGVAHEDLLAGWNYDLIATTERIKAA
jgi:hypothetical protein